MDYFEITDVLVELQQFYDKYKPLLKSYEVNMLVDCRNIIVDVWLQKAKEKV